MPPGTLLREFRARWKARSATWNAFARIPCQVDGRERTPDTLLWENRARWKTGRCHLTRFRSDTVPGGRQEVLPGTLSQENRGRWEAGRCHLEHFCRNSVPGGRQEVPPGTLLRGFRARWTAGSDTWNTLAGKPCQVGYLSAGTYCGAPPVLPTMRAPSLLGSRCRLRPLYVPDISQDTGLKL